MGDLFVQVETEDEIFSDSMDVLDENRVEEEQEQERNLLKELYALTKRNVSDENIKQAIEKIAKDFDYPYLEAVKKYLELSSNRRHLLNGVFFDDFYDAKEFDYISVKCLEYEGLFDRLAADTSENLSIVDILRDTRGLFQLAQMDDPILIVGETGTGKELLARSIHKMSKVRRAKLVELNCSALPNELLESELFGWEKGAHSKADKLKLGLIEMADKGMLFLDELGKMPKHLQAKLLKVIEEKQFYRLGALKPITVDVRFIAAAQPRNIDNTDISNSDIYDDLLYRLGYPDVITLPTLNQRLRELSFIDITQIMKNATIKILKKMDLNQISITSGALNMLIKFNYHGNYRELENILRRAIRSAKVSRRNKVLPEDLQLINSQQSEYSSLNDYTAAYKEIKLKDVIDYANGFRDLLVITKYERTLQEQKDLKSALLSQGLPEKEYQNLWKKFDAIKKRAKKRKAHPR